MADMRLIDANTLVDANAWTTKQYSEEEFVAWIDGIELMKEKIRKAPTVKLCSSGRWVGKGMNVRCSECGESPIMDMDVDVCWFWDFRPKFCPNCGAKMERTMAKNKLKDSFYWMGQDGQECNVDLSSKTISRYINDAKNSLKKIPKGKGDFCFISGKEALVVGVVNKDGEKSIFVARDYWEADYLPECGWVKVEEGEDESFEEDDKTHPSDS